MMLVMTCEAIRATALPPERSVRLLILFAEYRDLAEAAITRGDDVGGKVWITKATVMASPPESMYRKMSAEVRHAKYGA